VTSLPPGLGDGFWPAAFTLDVYTHLLPDDLPDADVLDDLTAPEGGNKGATRLTETSRDADSPGVAVSGF
jgi:hypothetical protein